MQEIDPALIDAIVESFGNNDERETQGLPLLNDVNGNVHQPPDAALSVDGDSPDWHEMNNSTTLTSQGSDVVTTVKVPSKSSILAFIRGESGDALRREIPVFSFKRETVRGVNANTDDNKEARVQAIETINGMIRGGYRWVCLDESSWCVATTAVYGWSKRGERCFVTKGNNGICITSIATIDATGLGDCFLVCGSTDRAVFEASFKRVMKTYDDIGVRAVFWCDNCSIHSGIRQLIDGLSVIFSFPTTNQRVV